MKKVFISYSRADYVDENGQVLDNSQVGAIVNALNATNKINVWIDINAKYSGKYFTSVLAKKILWADKVLFLSSKNSNESEWVSKEILFAHDNNKEILPIRLDETSYNVDFAIILTGIDYIEYYKSPKYKITDIIENIIGDSQRKEDVIETPKNTLLKSHVSNQKEQKGCLSLNVNFRGCAMTMTIMMGILLILGIFIPPNPSDIEGEPLAIKDKTGRDNTSSNGVEAPTTNTTPDDIMLNSSESKPMAEPSKTNRQKKKQKNTKMTRDSVSSPIKNKDDSGLYFAQNKENTDSDIIVSGVTHSQISFGHVAAAHPVDSWVMTFRGGEAAYVYIAADGDTEFDAFVYDFNNDTLVASHTADDGYCVLKWTPRWTGQFKIVVKNVSRMYPKFTIRSNRITGTGNRFTK